MSNVTGHDYIVLEEEKQALLLCKVSKGAMLKIGTRAQNLKKMAKK